MRGYSDQEFWIPGSEPTHLDLEKLFLLSDSLGNLSFHGKNETSGPEQIEKPKTSCEKLVIPESSSLQLSIYRLWYEESDFQVKIEQFWRPEVKI